MRYATGVNYTPRERQEYTHWAISGLDPLEVYPYKSNGATANESEAVMAVRLDIINQLQNLLLDNKLDQGIEVDDDSLYYSRLVAKNVVGTITYIKTFEDAISYLNRIAQNPAMPQIAKTMLLKAIEHLIHDHFESIKNHLKDIKLRNDGEKKILTLDNAIGIAIGILKDVRKSILESENTIRYSEARTILSGIEKAIKGLENNDFFFALVILKSMALNPSFEKEKGMFRTISTRLEAEANSQMTN